MSTIKKLVAVAKVQLLEEGGVDNWEWYSESLEDYVESSDLYEDAESFLNALENSGVDNWEWYDESLTGLSDYEEYLEGLSNLDKAMSIDEWKDSVNKNTAEAQFSKIAVDDESEQKIQKSEIKNESERLLFSYIEGKFGSDCALDIYHLAKINDVWKRTTFPKEFDLALKVIKQGVDNALEVARQNLIQSVMSNGKLDEFLDSLNK